MTYRAPEPLAVRHVLDRFRSASAEQTAWLHRFARSSQASSLTRVSVVTADGSDEVVAYYAWRMAEIALERSPERMRRGAGRYPQPVALLARLAVDVGHEGRGLGAALLADVLARTATLSDRIGCRALLIHCATPSARAFYEHLLPDLMRSPTDPLQLVLLVKDLRRTLRAGDG